MLSRNSERGQFDRRALGLALFRKLSNRQFNYAVYGLLIAAGLTLVAKFA